MCIRDRTMRCLGMIPPDTSELNTTETCNMQIHYYTILANYVTGDRRGRCWPWPIRCSSTDQEEAALTSRIEPEILELHARLCRTLAHPVRLAILNALREGEHGVGELTELVQVPQPTVSQHLAVLRNQGLLRKRRNGNEVFYRIAYPKMIQACDLLREVLFEHLREQERLVVAEVERGAEAGEFLAEKWRGRSRGGANRGHKSRCCPDRRVGGAGDVPGGRGSHGGGAGGGLLHHQEEHQVLCGPGGGTGGGGKQAVSYTHLRAHETKANLVCRLLLEKKK